jgi:hypothetical protein
MAALVDNKLLKLDNETIPLSAISSLSLHTNKPGKAVAIFGIFGGVVALAASVYILAIIALIIVIALMCISNHYLLINLHSGRTVRLDMSKKQILQAQHEIENALLNLPTEAALLHQNSLTSR